MKLIKSPIEFSPLSFKDIVLIVAGSHQEEAEWKSSQGGESERLKFGSTLRSDGAYAGHYEAGLVIACQAEQSIVLVGGPCPALASGRGKARHNGGQDKLGLGQTRLLGGLSFCCLCLSIHKY